MRHAIRDLQIIPEQEALLPAVTHEVFVNFGIYESVKVVGGGIVCPRDHIERLFFSADSLGINHRYTEQEIIDAMFALILEDGICDASLRIQIIGTREPILLIFALELPVYPDSYYLEGVEVISYPGERLLPEVKSNSLLLNYLALRGARDVGAFEALLVDRYGCAIEGTRSNVFVIQDGRLMTPMTGVLAGVTRKYLMVAAEEAGIPVIDHAPVLTSLLDGVYDEVFISSTSMGAMPVTRIDGRAIGIAGSLTKRLHKRLREIESKSTIRLGN